MGIKTMQVTEIYGFSSSHLMNGFMDIQQCFKQFGKPWKGSWMCALVQEVGMYVEEWVECAQ